MARAMSAQQLSCLNYRKACKCCLMVLSGSGLSGFPKSISVLSLKYRLTSALKTLSVCWTAVSLEETGQGFLKYISIHLVCYVVFCGVVVLVLFVCLIGREEQHNVFCNINNLTEKVFDSEMFLYFQTIRELGHR